MAITDNDIVAGEDVLPPLAAWRRGCADQTAAFAGQIIFIAPMRDVTAEPLLAQPVIDRGVDVVDTGVEYLVEDGFCLSLGDVAGTRGPTQFHRPLAQGCDLQSSPPELSFCYGHFPSSTRKVGLMLDRRPRSVEWRFLTLGALCPAPPTARCCA